MRPLTAPRRQTAVPRRDPAPSRLAYRIDRLWLTPMFRKMMRVGLPVGMVVLAVVVWLGDAGRRAAIVTQFTDLRRSIEERPEFMVTMMAIDGASPAVAQAVRKMIPVTLPVSSFNLDLEALRATIVQVDAVASADLRIRAGGILQVDIRERVPAVLWRTAGGIDMLDSTGHRVATLLVRNARADLPVIAGPGADEGVAEALAVIKAAGPVAPRIRGLVRIGERRWDIVLDRDQRILLPEQDPVSAVERVVALDEAQDLLNRDVAAVDMRNKDRPTVRMATGAVAERRHTAETKAAEVTTE
jgi:cell division protein FtsQ